MTTIVEEVVAAMVSCSYLFIIIIIIIIIHELIKHASSVMILNQRRWQSLGGQHDFQTAFESG